MYEGFVNFKDEEQRKNVLRLFYLVLSENKPIDFISVDYVRQYLNDEDTAVFLELMSKYLNMKKTELNKKIADLNINITYVNFNKINQIKRRKTPNQDMKLEWEEITPYKTLGINQGEYTKEQLLDIVANRINLIKEKNESYKQLSQEIDAVLDAYNELTKESYKQK